MEGRQGSNDGMEFSAVQPVQHFVHRSNERPAKNAWSDGFHDRKHHGGHEHDVSDYELGFEDSIDGKIKESVLRSENEIRPLHSVVSRGADNIRILSYLPKATP